MTHVDVPMMCISRHLVSPSDLHALADAVGPRWRCLIYMGGVMGLRLGEAAALRLVDIDLASAEVSIGRTLTENESRLSFGPPKTAAGIPRPAMPGPLVQELTAHCV